MKYRKTVILACVACAAVLISILLLGFFQAWSGQARDVQVYTVVHQLASLIRSFKMEKGHYPKSLEELRFADFWREDEKKTVHELIGTTQQNNWHDVYSYTPLTNGFSIVVHNTEPARAIWLAKPLKTLRYSEIDGKTVDFDEP